MFNISPDPMAQHELYKEMKEEFKKKLYQKARESITHKLHCMFLDKTHTDEHRYLHMKDILDKDFGAGHEMIREIIDEQFLSDKFKEYAQRYIEQHFQEHLNKALDEAMQHQARKIAFSQIKEQAPRIQYP